jgi:DNA-binding response OmpR family regulator
MQTGPSAILHIEDDPNDAALLDHACRRAGVQCRLVTVSDGDEALAYLQGKDQFSDRDKYPLPRLILLDLKMPRLSGFEVLAWVRSHATTKLMPVVILSSSNHHTDVKKAYDLGANSYLIKPVAFEGLVEVVKALHHYWISLNVTLGD